PPFRGLRVPARFRAVVGLYLALVAGVGIAALSGRARSPRAVRLALGAAAVALIVGVHPIVALQPVWTPGRAIYRRVPDPHAVIANLPLPWGQDPFWHDPVYVYFSTFHWHPIVNGSSGFSPPWYDELGSVSRFFPSDAALDAHRRLGTEYFVL